GGLFRIRAGAPGDPLAITFHLGAREGLPNWVFQLYQTSDGRLWAGTAVGFAELYPDGDRAMRLFCLKHGLNYHESSALCEDPAGNLWLGSIAGAMKLSRNGFVTYGEDDGTGGTNAIFEDGDGSLCFRGAPPDPKKTYVTRLGCYDGERFRWFIPRE